MKMAPLKSSEKPFFHKKGQTIERALAGILKDTKTPSGIGGIYLALLPLSSFWLCDNSITTVTSSVGTNWEAWQTFKGSFPKNCLRDLYAESL